MITPPSTRFFPILPIIFRLLFLPAKTLSTYSISRLSYLFSQSFIAKCRTYSAKDTPKNWLVLQLSSTQSRRTTDVLVTVSVLIPFIHLYTSWYSYYTQCVRTVTSLRRLFTIFLTITTEQNISLAQANN